MTNRSKYIKVINKTVGATEVLSPDLKNDYLMTTSEKELINKEIQELIDSLEKQKLEI